jgi:class 3 adenylate cyclase
MEFRTENLTILFVDIAGFTETTSRQSRAENFSLLENFDRILKPIIKGFKGRLIKSIGDALLITFSTPTDAMLCAMAFQDAIHEHNLELDESAKLHISVGANLGEVRVEKKDIYGEPVNVASRIEGVTPANEIYLSEAVYMAMNKAEVPVQDVGIHELSGITKPVRLYCVPRYSSLRLVSESQPPQTEQEDELMFPYGGMHHRMPSGHHYDNVYGNLHFSRFSLLITAVILSVVSAMTVFYLNQSPELKSVPLTIQPQTNSSSAKSDTSQPEIKKAQPEDEQKTVTDVNKSEPETIKKPIAEVKNVQPQVEQKTVTAVKKVIPKTVTEIEKKPVAQVKKPVPEPVAKPEPIQWDVTKAKKAYRAKEMTKREYKVLIGELKKDYREKIVKLKADYRAKVISKDEYNKRARKAKKEYNGS